MSQPFVSWQSLRSATEVPLLREGVPSFHGLPIARTQNDLRGADVAVVGIPSGAQASPGRPPDQWAHYGLAVADTRRFSMRYGGYLPELDLDVFEHLRVVDYGDVEIIPGDVQRSLDNTARTIGDVLEAGCRLVTLGGCVPYASYSVVGALARSTTGPVGVISLDAHGDCLQTLYGDPAGRELGAGTWQARMWDDFPNIDPTRHVEIGMRGPRNVREMVHRYRANGGHFYPMATVRSRGMLAVCAEAYPYAFSGAARTWFSLDMDVLDIGAIPGWGDEAIGPTTWEVMEAIHEAGKTGIDALSFQFIAPDSPPASAIACYGFVYLLAGWVLGGGKVTVP